MKYMLASHAVCKFEDLEVGEFFKNPFNGKVFFKIANDSYTLVRHDIGSSSGDKNQNAFCLDDNTLEYFMPDSNAVALEPDLILTEKK